MDQVDLVVLGVNRQNDSGEKKEQECKNERAEEKNNEDINETLKGSGGGKRRTENNRKLAEGTSKLSCERQIIAVK